MIDELLKQMLADTQEDEMTLCLYKKRLVKEVDEIEQELRKLNKMSILINEKLLSTYK